MKKFMVTVLPNNEQVEISQHETLYAALKAKGHAIKSTCGGCASCGQCVVKIVAGAENLLDPSFEETQLMGNVFHLTQERLSCQTYLRGDVSVDISEHLNLEVSKKPVFKVRKKEDMLANDKQEDNAEVATTMKPKKLGGGKKPRAFKYNEEN